MCSSSIAIIVWLHKALEERALDSKVQPKFSSRTQLDYSPRVCGQRNHNGKECVYLSTRITLCVDDMPWRCKIAGIGCSLPSSKTIPIVTRPTVPTFSIWAGVSPKPPLTLVYRGHRQPQWSCIANFPDFEISPSRRVEYLSAHQKLILLGPAMLPFVLLKASRWNTQQ